MLMLSAGYRYNVKLSAHGISPVQIAVKSSQSPREGEYVE